MEKVKLCTDCKSYFDNWKNAVSAGMAGLLVPSDMCANPSLVDPVRGWHADCRQLRANCGECGKEGRYWEPKG